MALGHMRADDEGVLNLKKIYLRQKGAVTLTENDREPFLCADVSRSFRSA